MSDDVRFLVQNLIPQHFSISISANGAASQGLHHGENSALIVTRRPIAAISGADLATGGEICLTFSWEPLDFLNALEVLPIEEDYGISYAYIVERGPLTLSLTIWPLDGDVALTLSCAGLSEPVVRLDLLNCPGARVVQIKEGSYIEFAAAKSFGGRYDHADVPPYGFRLHVQPFLQVTTFAHSV